MISEKGEPTSANQPSCQSIGQPFNPYKLFPGAFIPEPICKYKGLSTGAKLVYGRLCRYAGAEGRAYPAMPTLAAETGVSETQARAYVKELEAKRFIEVDRKNRHYRKDGSGGSNGYVFLVHAAFTGDTGELRKAPPPLRKTEGVPVRKTEPLTPAENRTRRESICLRESVKESQTKADSSATPRKTREAHPGSQVGANENPKGEESRADPPAKNAGEENPLSVEEETPKADPRHLARELTYGAPGPPPWTGIDVSHIRKVLSAFMEGQEPPPKLIEWICLTFKGLCSARDVCSALEAAWNRRAAPGKKNAPRTWNWFYSVLRNALIPGEAGRLPEHPAASHPDHKAGPLAMSRGIEAIELPHAPGSIVDSVRCANCGGCALVRYTDGRIEGCGCRSMHREHLDRISRARPAAFGGAP